MKHTGAHQVESCSSAVAIAISPQVLNIEIRTQLAVSGQKSPKGPPNIEFFALGTSNNLKIVSPAKAGA